MEGRREGDADRVREREKQKMITSQITYIVHEVVIV